MKKRHPFVISEIYIGKQGIQCEYPGCHQRTFTIYLKPEDKFLGNYGYEASMNALKLGEALCDQHAPKNQAQNLLIRSQTASS